MAELINISTYKIGPKLPAAGGATGQMEYLQDAANKPKGVSPENVISVDEIPTATRVAWQTPGIYGKIVVNEGGLVQEYYTSQTVAQLVTAAG